MWQVISSIVAAVVAPVVGAGLSASRRSRLAGRIRALHKLADDIEAHDATGAAALRDLAAQMVRQVVELERQSLSRTFDPIAPFVYLIFVLPAAMASFFAWKYGGWWTWPVLIVSALWALIVAAAARSEFWKEREAAEQAEAASHSST